MAITIAYANWRDPATRELHRIHANDYDSKRDGGELICPHPGCGCPLKHVPQHQSLGGSISVSAHFARATGKAFHNRDSGCNYPNQAQDPKAEARVEEQNQLIAFFERRGRSIIYLNSGYEKTDFRLSEDRKAAFRYAGNHLTAKQNPADRTISIKSVRDLILLSRYKSFRDPFFDTVYVVANGYRLPFRDFLVLNEKELFNQAFLNVRRNFKQAVAIEIMPLIHKTDFDVRSGRTFIPCKPGVQKGRQSGFEYNIQPVIVTSDPELARHFHDSSRALVWGPATVEANVRGKLSAIRSGAQENALKVYVYLRNERMVGSLEDPKLLAA